MELIYTWTIVQMDCYPQIDGLNEVVFRAYWVLNGFDGTYNTSVQGSQDISAPGVGTFIPYQNLTKDQVIQWVLDTIGAEQVASYQDQIAKQIAKMINPPVVTLALPWPQDTQENN